jgi:hypothetical protein
MRPSGCPLLALSGHPSSADQCPLSGVKRTWRIAVQMSAFDPKRTLGQWKICDLGHSGGREQPPRCGLNLGAIAMFANLGKVIYWVAYAVALLLFGLATLVWFTERQSGDLGLIGNLVLIGMTALVIGVGCRYVLARAVGRP